MIVIDDGLTYLPAGLAIRWLPGRTEREANRGAIRVGLAAIGGVLALLSAASLGRRLGEALDTGRLGDAGAVVEGAEAAAAVEIGAARPALIAAVAIAVVEKFVDTRRIEGDEAGIAAGQEAHRRTSSASASAAASSASTRAPASTIKAASAAGSCVWIGQGG